MNTTLATLFYIRFGRWWYAPKPALNTIVGNIEPFLIIVSDKLFLNFLKRKNWREFNKRNCDFYLVVSRVTIALNFRQPSAKYYSWHTTQILFIDNKWYRLMQVYYVVDILHKLTKVMSLIDFFLSKFKSYLIFLLR